MLPDIRHLLDLQELDREIATLGKQLEEIPRRREELQAELQRLEQDFTTGQADFKSREKELRRMEQDIEDLRGSLTKLKQKQLQVKTNQEYQAALHEMDFLSRKISDQEDSVLEGMEAMDQLRASLEGSCKRCEQGKKDIAAELGNLNNSATFLENEINRAAGRRADALARVPAKAMALYNKLLPVSGGIVVAEARDELCTACRVMLRPQFYQELLRGAEILQCENCRRILYIAE
ncbi:MAG: hypothetical protein KA419_13040 [Acidobacteria bacterium]|nr:hypothetical protein [Acidobacteriota bacterium]